MLISINDTAPWGTIYADSITIDAAGRTTAENETTPTQLFTLSTAVAATYDADNRLASVNGTAVTFDADGNMLSGPAPGTLTDTGYSYNARNQLIEAGGFAYTYGVLGNRIAVRSPFNAYTTFVVDPNAALDRVLSRTVSGSSGASTTYYVYGLGLIGEESGGVFKTYHFDSRGSTVALTDISANVTDTFSYGPYGEPANHTGSSTTPFQYNGQFAVQTDPSGPLYMRARYYNPAIKRFINQDALFGTIDPGISLNRFGFANGDPVDGFDPTGYVRWDALGWAAVKIVGGTGAIVLSGAALAPSAGATSLGMGAGFLALLDGVVELGYSFNDNPSTAEKTALSKVPSNYTEVATGLYELAGGQVDPNIKNLAEATEATSFLLTDVGVWLDTPKIGASIVTLSDVLTATEVSENMRNTQTTQKGCTSSQ